MGRTLLGMIVPGEGRGQGKMPIVSEEVSNLSSLS